MRRGLLALSVFFVACGHAPHQIDVRQDQIRFHLAAPQARDVVLVVISAGVHEHSSELKANGKWETRVSLKTLTPCEGLKYFYLVDSKPFLPDCPMKAMDDFGAENCVLSMTAQAKK